MGLLPLLSKDVVCFAEDKPTIYVEPSQTINMSLIPGKNFMVEIKLRNGTNLYGVELKFAWSNALLRYLSHTTLIGQPGGVLNSPATTPKNGIFQDAQGNDFYWLIATSMYPAIAWSGSGTIVRVTFEVKDTGWCILDLHSTDLVNSGAQKVSHYVEDGYFCNIEFQGDVNGDDKVGLSDLVLLAKAYGSHLGDPNWDSRCDFNNDLTIGLSDLVLLAKNYGRTRP